MGMDQEVQPPAISFSVSQFNTWLCWLTQNRQEQVQLADRAPADIRQPEDILKHDSKVCMTSVVLNGVFDCRGILYKNNKAKQNSGTSLQWK